MLRLLRFARFSWIVFGMFSVSLNWGPEQKRCSTVMFPVDIGSEMLHREINKTKAVVTLQFFLSDAPQKI